ncbi:MAG TPA: peptide deformylase [Ignavibacteriales bacterium]|nr:peptide deformylase [Ignavibacteriales bacterium]HEX3073376.1 peptide deformylase [Ignavibacteriales bacterium]
MAIIPINIYGDPILRKKTKPVTHIDDKFIADIKSMFQTMRKASGVGLAGNQVGMEKSLFVIDVSPVEGYEHIKPIVMINPKIKLYSDEKEIKEEGCLSLPYLGADVERSLLIQVSFFDTDMKEHSIEAHGHFARVIQHEYDHLQGKFFTDRVDEDVKKLIKKDLERFKKGDFDADYPTTR